VTNKERKNIKNGKL